MPVCAHWPNTAPSFNEDPRKGRHWSSDNAIDANDEGIKSIFDSLKSMPTLKDVPVDVPEPLPAEQQEPAAQDPQPFVAQNPTMQQSRVFRTQRETGNMSSATVAATDNRTQCDTIRHWLTPHRLHCIVLAAYVIVVGTVMCFHEPWFDEAQAWLIARDCSWWEMILERPHYEGHPPLWWMMLADLQSLHKLRSDVKQQVSAAVSNLHNAEAAASAIAADRTEAVTNSYSVPFFGADRDLITNQQQSVAEYATDAHSDQLATAIHDGNCG